MSNLVDAILAIQDEIEGLVKRAPNYPTDSVNEFPVCFTYPSEGEFVVDSFNGLEERHVVITQVLWSHTDTARNMEALLPYLETIKRALWPTHMFATDYELQSSRYRRVTVTWGETNCIGWEFTLTLIKHSSMDESN